MTKAEYELFAKEIQAGGFYTNGLRPVGADLFSTVVCSKKRIGGGYTGNSFWVTRFGGHWCLGTWGGMFYQLPDTHNIAEVCLAWLRRKPDGTSSDFDEALKSEFDLVQLSFEELKGRRSAANVAYKNDAS